MASGIAIAALVIACVAFALLLLGLCLVFIALRRKNQPPPQPPAPAPPPQTPPRQQAPQDFTKEVNAELQKAKEQAAADNAQLNARTAGLETRIQRLQQFFEGKVTELRELQHPIVAPQPQADEHIEQANRDAIQRIWEEVQTIKAQQARPQPVPVVPAPASDPRVAELAKEFGAHVDNMAELEREYNRRFDELGKQIAYLKVELERPIVVPSDFPQYPAPVPPYEPPPIYVQEDVSFIPPRPLRLGM
eukprot:TRINITY_DN5582_c0_g1_i1.p1 TRINITY_DN5582_c0_g1~~TRINITY_DN5582_c0_g1_i1.p1  ORF type:complete len:255 (-),score=46.31 TRINITY_DN5582_c0_g1_i1:42-785(-)